MRVHIKVDRVYTYLYIYMYGPAVYTITLQTPIISLSLFPTGQNCPPTCIYAEGAVYVEVYIYKIVCIYIIIFV